MKKLAITLMVILAASLTMAGSSNSEKLKHDENNWDRQWEFIDDPDSDERDFRIQVNMLLHHGIAEAASNNGKFSILITAVDHDGNNWDTTNPIAHDDTSWDKESKFVPVQGVVEWNGDDDGSGIIESISIALLGPSGKAMGSAVIAETGGVLYFAPTSVQHDDNDWDSEASEFVLSMSATEEVVSYTEKQGWCVDAVALIVDGTNIDEYHWNSDCQPIQRLPGAGPDLEGFIAIEPLRIFWDRNEGTYTGTAKVEVTTQLVGPSGDYIGPQTTSPAFDIIIPDGGPCEDCAPLTTNQ